ncbi:S24 family peptidase [uncultured Cedecea sp.]|uniref:LexA family protein n=1 Tax=uncultured Cedecea sp. TaxID=988762 RepID=UPI002637E5FE|nr:S24 family peptidase [uncultured Cedecea sp.]
MVQKENMREEFAQRLAQACREAGLDEHGRGMVIARALKLSSKGVSKWFNAESMPRQETMNELAKLLRVDVVWLQHGMATELKGDNFSYAGPYTPGRKYPVLSSIQAGSWGEAVEAYTLQDVGEWLDSDAHVQGEAFWLQVDGDSMTAPTGTSVPQGSYVLFDTGKDAINGSLVIAKLTDSNEATFKKLVIDAGQKYLKGLNPAWPMVPINGNCRIIGVAVEARMLFK